MSESAWLLLLIPGFLLDMVLAPLIAIALIEGWDRFRRWRRDRWIARHPDEWNAYLEAMKRPWVESQRNIDNLLKPFYETPR